jgi:hypothetical protein
MLESLDSESIQRFLDSQMAGLCIRSETEAGNWGSKYIYVGYEGKVSLPICIKIRIGNHPSLPNYGKYYFANLRSDCPSWFNEARLKEAIEHVRAVVDGKKVIGKKRF